MKLRRKQLMDLFYQLDAPNMSEVHGEYRAFLLDSGHIINSAFASSTYISLKGIGNARPLNLWRSGRGMVTIPSSRHRSGFMRTICKFHENNNHREIALPP